MATTVKSVLDEARDYNALFSNEKVPTKIALRQMGRLERQLLAMGAEVNPTPLMTNNIGSEQSVGNNAAKLAGYALPAAVVYGDFYVNYTGDEATRRELFIVDASRRQDPITSPSAYIEGDTLYPVDPEGENWNDEDDRAGWTDADTIEWHYIAEPSIYSAVSGNITAPDHAAGALAAMLAEWMSMRVVAELGNGARFISAAANDRVQAWLEQLRNYHEDEVRYVRWKGY